LPGVTLSLPVRPAKQQQRHNLSPRRGSFQQRTAGGLLACPSYCEFRHSTSSMSYRTQGAHPEQILTPSARFKYGPATKFAFYADEKKPGYRVKVTAVNSNQGHNWGSSRAGRAASRPATQALSEQTQPSGNTVAKQKTGKLSSWVI